MDGIRQSGTAEDPDIEERPIASTVHNVQRRSGSFLARWLPGIVTGGADNDPAGISTYSISGATYGYTQLWLMVLAIPMLIAVQSMCTRVGAVKKQGLSRIFRMHFHPVIAWMATLGVVLANVFTIGADLVGMAAVLGLMLHVNSLVFVGPLTFLVWYLVIFKSYRAIIRLFQWLMFFFLSYVVAAILAKPAWGEVMRDLIWPLHGLSSANYWMAAVGILGTTVTPYLFYWQTKEEVEERRRRREAADQADHADFYNAPGFVFSQVITVFIMLATGATLHVHRQPISTAVDAAAALEPLVGPMAKYVFALGVLGAGLLAVPVLAAATGYVVADTAGWKDSLNDDTRRARGFYAVITIALLAGVVIMVLGLDPIKAMFYSQIANGILGPPLILLILQIANDRKVMGKYVNGPFDNLFGWLAVLVMVFSAFVMFYQLITGTG